MKDGLKSSLLNFEIQNWAIEKNASRCHFSIQDPEFESPQFCVTTRRAKILPWPAGRV